MAHSIGPGSITDASSPFPDSLSPPPAPMAMPSPSPFSKRLDEIRPPKSDIHAMIIDYLVINGYLDTARKFAAEANIDMGFNDHDMQARVIKHDILNGNLEAAIEKINDLSPEILDTDPKLHFSLLRLHLIEIIRRSNPNNKEDLMIAIAFANQNLAPRTKNNQQFIEDLELAMALLIFPRETLPNELSALLEPDLRQRTADAVNQAILRSQDRRQATKIGNLLKARQWSEQKCREMKKTIPNRLYLGIEKEKEDVDDDVNMNGNGGNNAMDAEMEMIAT